MSKTVNIDEYLDLISTQHNIQPKFIEYNKTFLEKVKGINDLLYSFDEAFNLENATGTTLDIIGECVGISRYLNLSDPVIPNPLTDKYYRLVIKSKVAQNHWDGTIEGLRAIASVLFPESAFDIIDYQNMTMEFMVIDPTVDDVYKALMLAGKVMPKPSGVRVTWTVLDSGIFGWDTETEFIKGWDSGIWSGN